MTLFDLMDYLKREISRSAEQHLSSIDEHNTRDLYRKSRDINHMKVMEIDEDLIPLVATELEYQFDYNSYKTHLGLKIRNAVKNLSYDIMVDNSPNRYVAVPLTYYAFNDHDIITIFLYINPDNFNICLTGNIGKQNIVLFNIKKFLIEIESEVPTDDKLTNYFLNYPLEGDYLSMVISPLVLRNTKSTYTTKLLKVFDKDNGSNKYYSTIIINLIVYSHLVAFTTFRGLIFCEPSNDILYATHYNFLTYNYNYLPYIKTSKPDLSKQRPTLIYQLEKAYECIDRRQEVLKIIRSRSPRVFLNKLMPDNIELYGYYYEVIHKYKSSCYQYTIDSFSFTKERKRVSELHSTIKAFQYLSTI